MAASADAMSAAPSAGAVIPCRYRLERKRRETRDTVTLELEAADQAAIPAFAAGQFNMLYVFGCGEVPVSISGDPAQPSRLTHTTRAAGAVTQAILRLRQGDLLGVRGPFGAAWPLEAAAGSDVVLVAGGLGLAPLRPALYRLLAERDRYGRIVLLYGARTPADLLYQRELKRWRGRFDLEIDVTVDRAPQQWRGNVGVVTALASRVPLEPLCTVAMLCGPEVMMRFAARELCRRGIPAERIFISMERNMKCATGFCGHCQFGPTFVCKDGPVFPYSRVERLLAIREL